MDIEKLINSIESNFDDELLSATKEGISLLALKNDALLSYISNLLILSASQLEGDHNLFDQSRKNGIEQRVTIEKGVKPLESKISYQIDKVLRAFKRFEEESTTTTNNDELSDSDEDLTSFKPNIGSMQKSAEQDDDSGLEDEDKKRYVVPKIQQTVPSFEKHATRRPKRRDMAMEEYIRESGDAPIAEPSIGSQIMDHGRGGERTAAERKKADEIRAYEEANFTRLSQTSTKRARKEAAQRQRDAISKNFFGEDWGFLDDRKRRKTRK